MSKLQELTNIYPVVEKIQDTNEYQVSFLRASKSLDADWKQFDTAAGILYKKLERPFESGSRYLRHELSDIRRRELDELARKIETESCMAYNIRKIGEIVSLANSPGFTPLLLTRYIEYLKDWESWSFGAEDGSTKELANRKKFSQSLDFSIGGEIARLGVAGQISLLRGKPQLKIRTASFGMMEKPQYHEDLIEYLKRKRANNNSNRSSYYARGKIMIPDLRGFYINTEVSPDEFFQGKQLVDCWKKYSHKEIAAPYSLPQEGYSQFVKGVKQIARIINSRIGQVPYYTMENSRVCYNHKTGEPTERTK